MRRRFFGRRSSRASFRGRRKRLVRWLPQIEFGAEGVVAVSGPGGPGISNWAHLSPPVESGTLPLMAFPLEDPTNPFVHQASRFAQPDDEITYMRIVGDLRFGLYCTDAVEDDYVLDYGIALVKGNYDQLGNWTVPNAEIPRPGPTFGPQDAPEKWFFRRTCVFKQKIITSSITGYIYRPQMMCTDELLPTGSFIDLHPKRKARYEEKLMIIAQGSTASPTISPQIIMNQNLRILTAKWG